MQIPEVGKDAATAIALAYVVDPAISHESTGIIPQQRSWNPWQKHQKNSYSP